MSDESPRRSLKDEIQKRKTQEVLRNIEAKQASQTTQSVPPRKTGPLTLPDDPAPRRTQTGSLVPGSRTSEGSRRATQTVAVPSQSRTRRRTVIALAAGLLASVICI